MTAADFNLGRYLPRSSLLHRLDARTKLLLIPATVVAVFACRRWLQLEILGGWTLLLLSVSGIGLLTHLRGLRLLRWLFLCTFVLHLLLTPGHTLFGLAWLSHEGLSRGGQVTLQLALAVLLSSLLTLTTPPTTLAGGLERLLKPLHLFGLGRDTGGLLVWVLHFVPLLREEAAQTLADVRLRQGERPGLLERARLFSEGLSPLLARLVARADQLAHELAAGRNPLAEEATVAQRPGLLDGCVLLLGVAVLLLVWGVH